MDGAALLELAGQVRQAADSLLAAWRIAAARTPAERQHGLRLLLERRHLDLLDTPFCETVALADLLIEEPIAASVLAPPRLREWQQRATAFLEVAEGYHALWGGPGRTRPEGVFAHGRA